MVTNLPPEAKAKFAKYQEARTPEEKLQALQEFLSAVPKHKGTENLVRWIRRRMAELREEIEEKKRSKQRGGGPSFFIPREGAAQIVLIGYTKSGKSTLMKTLTNAKVVISDIPYATKTPVPGIFVYNDIQFQLIDTPSIVPDEDVKINRRVIGLARNADGIIMTIDLSQDPVAQFTSLRDILEKEGIIITRPSGRVEIIKSSGVNNIKFVFMGELVDAGPEDVKKLLESYKIYRAEIKIIGKVTLEDVENALMGVNIYKPTIVIGTKKDLDVKGDNCRRLVEAVGNMAPVMCVSEKEDFSDALGRYLTDLLELIRVYTKPPNGKISEKPLIIKRGTTVIEIAKILHEDLYKGFQYAKIWGPSAKYPGMRVGKDHVVEDGDIIEIHAKNI